MASYEGAGAAVPDQQSSRRRRVVLRVLLVTALVLVVAIVVSSLVTVPDYAITPGSATQVRSLISLPSKDAHSHDGEVLLTDVELVPLRAINYLFYKWNSDDDVEPTDDVIGPLTAAQYDEQGVIDMSTARQAATVVALKTVGYKVQAVPSGVADYQAEPGSPAASTLQIGDVITMIGGHSTDSLAALQSVEASLAPGDRVTISYHFLGKTKSSQVSLILGKALAKAVGSAENPSYCLPADSTRSATLLDRDGHEVACLGLIDPDPIYTTADEPFPITLDSGDIIGPSAGLAFTLGLLQELDADDLTGGAKVAATGTMSVTGAVGDVGGVAQKTVAVRDAGATLFLVPPEEYSVAKAHAGSDLKVVAVSSISQAIAALKAIGGRIALRPVPTS